MKNFNIKNVQIKIIGFATLEASLVRTNAPQSIQIISNNLPLKGRAFLNQNRLILSTNLRIGAEGGRNEFSLGDISFDTSSGNLTIHFGTVTLPNVENYLGNIDTDLTGQLPSSSHAVIIAEG